MTRLVAQPLEAEAPHRLGDGTGYFAQLGEVSDDEATDKVQCHLCGGWFRGFGGSHLRRTHGWTLAEYREAFQLRAMSTNDEEASF